MNLLSDFELASYLEELSAEAPCGDDLEYDPAFIALAEQVKGKAEQRIGDTVKPAEPPKWDQVEKNAFDLLGRTRDLRLMEILAQAAVHTSGLSGLKQCLTLLAGLLETRWEKIHPQLDPDESNDPTQRNNILLGLCDFDKMIQPINRIPLIESRTFGQFSLRDVLIASGKLSVADVEDELPESAQIEAAFKEVDLDVLQAKSSIVADCITQLSRVEAAVSKQIGNVNTPDFSPLRDVLQEIHRVITEHSAQLSVEEVPGTVELDRPEFSSTASDSIESLQPIGSIQNSQDVIRTLDLVCAYYKRFEPSSPIPILINRAKRLVAKDFIDIIKDLMPDAVGQAEMLKGPKDE